MTIEIYTRDFHNFNQGKFNLDLALNDWSEGYEKSSLSEMFEAFGLTVEKVISAHAPYHTKYQSKTGYSKQKTMD